MNETEPVLPEAAPEDALERLRSVTLQGITLEILRDAVSALASKVEQLEQNGKQLGSKAPPKRKAAKK